MKREKIFVYGSLKKGFYNQDYLKNAKFLGESITKSNIWAMRSLPSKITGEFFPTITQSGTLKISGELYGIDNSILSDLDRLEKIGETYNREEIELENNYIAWIYVYINKDCKKVKDNKRIKISNRTVTWT